MTGIKFQSREERKIQDAIALMERQQQREKHKTEVKSPKKTPPEPSTSKKSSSSPKEAVKPAKAESVKQQTSSKPTKSGPQKIAFKLPAIASKRTSRPSDSKSTLLLLSSYATSH